MNCPTTKWMQLVRDADICQTTTEPHSPWQNRCETEIKDIKKHTTLTMKRTSAPPCICDLCCEYVCEIRSRTAHPWFQLGSRTPYEYEVVTGNTPDISEWLEHSFMTLFGT